MWTDNGRNDEVNLLHKVKVKHSLYRSVQALRNAGG
jgi:hypothetical protein